jgi:Uma2 family endonuclease
MLLSLEKITVPIGQKLIINDLSWQEFENVLEDLGEHRGSRIAYNQGRLEIMTPLPEHEVTKILIGNLVEALLEELDREFWCLGSTTFKNQLLNQGIEPDNCFYIKNEQAVRGKDRLDLTIDPPPDLALEIDLTSRSYPELYASLGVPELWRFFKGNLQINILENGQYRENESSLIFPNFPLKKVIPEYIHKFKTEGRNKTMRAFRDWVRKQIENNL